MTDFYRDFVFTRNTTTVAPTDTAITVEDVSLFPSNNMLAKGDFYIAFESSLSYPPTFEIMKLTNVNTSTKTLTVIRAQAGTTAQQHAIVTYIKGTLTSDMLRRARWAFSGTTAPAPDADIFGVGDRFYHTAEGRFYVFTGNAGYLGDTFTRTASTTTMGSTETQTLSAATLGLPPGSPATYTVPYVAPWFTLTTGVFGINANGQAYLASAGAANSTSVVNSGSVNVDFQFDVFASTTAASDYGLIFRYDQSASYGYYLQFLGTTATLYRLNGTIFTSLALTTTYTTNVTHTWRVVANGNNITVYKDGTSAITFTESLAAFMQPSTVVGAHIGFRYGNTAAVSDAAIVWDNFSCTTPGNTTVNTPTPQGWAPTSDVPTTATSPVNYLAKQLQSVETSVSTVAQSVDDVTTATANVESTVAKHDTDIPSIVQTFDDTLDVIKTIDNRQGGNTALFPVLTTQVDELLATLQAYGNAPNVRTTSVDTVVADGDILFANATGQPGRAFLSPPPYDTIATSASANATLNFTAAQAGVVVSMTGEWSTTGSTMRLDGNAMTQVQYQSNTTDVRVFASSVTAAGAHSVVTSGQSTNEPINVAVMLDAATMSGYTGGGTAVGSGSSSATFSLSVSQNTTIVVFATCNGGTGPNSISNTGTALTWTQRATFSSPSTNAVTVWTAPNPGNIGTINITVSGSNTYLTVAAVAFAMDSTLAGAGNNIYTTVTLPAPTKATRITVIDNDPVATNTVRFSGGTINGSLTYYLQGNGDTAQLVADGTNWYDLSTKITVAPVTSDYQMYPSDGIVLANGTLNVTLPTVSNSGQRYTIKNVGTGTITVRVAVTSTALIDGQASISITQNNSVDVVFDGTNWWVI